MEGNNNNNNINIKSVYGNKTIDSINGSHNNDSNNSLENNNINLNENEILIEDENNVSNKVETSVINNSLINENTQEKSIIHSNINNSFVNNSNRNINVNATSDNININNSTINNNNNGINSNKTFKERKKNYIKYFKEFSRLALKTPDILNNDEDQNSFSESRISSSYLSTSFSSNNNINNKDNSLLNNLDISTNTSYNVSQENSNNLSEDIINISVNQTFPKNNDFSEQSDKSLNINTSKNTNDNNYTIKNDINNIDDNNEKNSNNNNSINTLSYTKNKIHSNSNKNSSSDGSVSSHYPNHHLMNNIHFHVHHHHTHYHRNNPNYSISQYDSSSSSSSRYVKNYPNYETVITPRILSSNGGSLREENAEIYYSHHPHYYNNNGALPHRYSTGYRYTSSSSIIPSTSSSYYQSSNGNNGGVSNSLQSEEINFSSKSILDKSSKETSNNLSIITNLDYSSYSSRSSIDPSYFNLILNFAIRVENFQLIQYLVESDDFKSRFESGAVDLNEKDIHGDYPLITAFFTNNMSIFKYLLEHGANCNVKNSNGSTLLTLAVHRNKYEIIKLMLNHYHHHLRHQYHSSLSHPKESPMNMKVNINEMDASGNSPLMKAINQNALDIVTLLAEYGVNNNIDMNGVNISGDTPLTLAYRLKYRTIFRYLLCYLDINQKDRQGNSVLYYAIDAEDIETIQYLIRNKVDVNSKNSYGVSCLDFAIAKGSKILNIFLKNNYDNIQFNLPNSKGEIPLITIIRAKNYTLEEKEEIVGCLLERGSNVNFIDGQGNTSIYYAVKKKLSPIVRLLIRSGANINTINASKHKTLLRNAPCLDSDITKYLMVPTTDATNDLTNSSNQRIDIDRDISESHTNTTGTSKFNFDMMEYLMF